uniref:Uncharacterized protein n=1 Tax=Cacopsylla melanoneura TaxID=428564 RepID=A0A8D8QR00_9HEMI
MTNQYGRAYYYYTVNLMRDICLSLNLRGVNYRKIEDDYGDFNRIKADNRAVYRRPKPVNRSALFNTTRKRGRFAHMSKTTTPPPLSTRLKTKWMKLTKPRQNTEIDSSEEVEEPYNGTTLSINQIYHIFYKYEGFDWLR